MTILASSFSPENAAQKSHPDAQIVTDVRHFTDSLFSFRVTRPTSLRFRSGEFLMIGLLGDNGKPLMRAYSICAPVWDEELEFYSIKVADGPLTSRLQNIQIGDEIIVRPKPVGSLVVDALLPGRNCYLVSTGTGIAPFASLLRDPELYAKFDNIVLTQTCRNTDDLAYGKELISRVLADPLVGDEAQEQLKPFFSTTRARSKNEGRITEYFENGQLATQLGLPAFGNDDRVMICGSTAFNFDMKAICENAGLAEGSNNSPGGYLIEKAFVG